MESEKAPDEGTLRFLKLLVTVLSVTMILGFVIIVVLFVMRFTSLGGGLELPEEITLPEGAKATAFTQGEDWFAVVTAGDEILIFDRVSGELRQRIAIVPE